MFNWKVTVFSAICLAGFLWLGFWQLDRAEAKTQLLILEKERARQPARQFSELLADTTLMNGTRVALSGRYDVNSVFLLDNRVLEGRVGFEVVAAFYDEPSQMTVLVNRGFVPMGRTRDDVVNIPPLGNLTTAVGTVHRFEGKTLSAPGAVMAGAGAVIIQMEDAALVADRFDSPVYAQVIRLDEDDPNALPRHWPISVMSPATHRGYAVQWFLMALAVLIAWSVFTFKHRKEDSTQ